MSTTAEDWQRMIMDHSASPCWPDMRNLIADLEAAEAERDRLEAHILDIDAHTTPSGSLDGEAVTTYILTAGALHRALGTVGHSAAKVVSTDDDEWMDAPLGPSKEPQNDTG